MRVEYGSVEKDGSPDLDVDWLADGWVALLHKWISDAAPPGSPSRTPWCWPRSMREGPSAERCCARAWTIRHHLLHQLRLRQGRTSSPRTPYASVTFPWYALGRQVHVRRRGQQGRPGGDGGILGLRPRGSQLGAGRPRSRRPIASRAELLAAAATGDRTVRRRRTCSGAAELGRLPRRARGRRVLAGPREPGAQPDSGARRGGRSSGCSPSGGGACSPTPRRCGRRTSVGCGWPASSPSSART